MEIVKTGKSLAVYINDVLMMNIPEKRNLKRGKFILQKGMSGSIDSMHIYDISPNASWPEEIRYTTPDHPSRQK